MRRKNAFLSCCLTLCLAVGMTVSVPVSAAAKTSTETQKSYPKYETYYVVNCKESITLRPQPDVSSGELCQIPYGSAVSYIESAQNGFYKIVYNGATGYGLAAYLSTDKPADSYYSSSSQPSTIMYPTYYVVNCKQSITLRTSPSTSASEICQIPLGSAVSYIETAQNGFYKIIYNGSTGYGLASYLSIYKSSGNVTSGYSSTYPTYYVVNCKQSITLRTNPSTSASEICQIPLGSAVSYISTASNGFYYISYNGNNG